MLRKGEEDDKGLGAGCFLLCPIGGLANGNEPLIFVVWKPLWINPPLGGKCGGFFEGINGEDWFEGGNSKRVSVEDKGAGGLLFSDIAPPPDSGPIPWNIEFEGDLGELVFCWQIMEAIKGDVGIYSEVNASFIDPTWWALDPASPIQRGCWPENLFKNFSFQIIVLSYK